MVKVANIVSAHVGLISFYIRTWSGIGSVNDGEP